VDLQEIGHAVGRKKKVRNPTFGLEYEKEITATKIKASKKKKVKLAP
jgi:hypothetical protein